MVQRHEEVGENDRDDGLRTNHERFVSPKLLNKLCKHGIPHHQFHHDVEGGPGGILEGITHGVADHSCCVRLQIGKNYLHTLQKRIGN